MTAKQATVAAIIQRCDLRFCDSTSRRSASPQELAAACRKVNHRAEIVPCDSLAEALQRAAGDHFLVITGSLYLIGEAMELLKLLPANTINERTLNEWTAPAIKS